jgi:uroporphyrin-3 C-methyltransferase
VSHPADTPAVAPAGTAGDTLAVTPAGVASQPKALGWREWVAIAGLVLSLASLALMLSSQQRLERQHEEWARRLQDVQQQSVESRTLARQAEAVTRDMAAKLSLLEARVSESSLQRSQLEELMQSLSRSRDENILADIEAALRVAQQQAALTGSVEPLAAVLKQTEERLVRVQQPRLERVRRAAVQDLEKVRAAGFVDITSLTIRLDEVTRQVDELPLLSGYLTGQRTREAVGSAVAPARATAASAAAANLAATAGAPAAGPRVAPAPPAAPSAVPEKTFATAWSDGAQRLIGHLWVQVRDLIRVTRIDEPEAALLAPEQATFLRENLRLRLLNARLSLLSRQFDAAQDDLREAQVLLERYFDKRSRRVTLAVELLQQVGAQSRKVTVPRPDATLSAIAAATPGK